ncbi:hypothetical protein FACS1894167_07590 [Synergistales bacterium]|nr:hypothetical protein FACS1894167_07590 [Synergistales bacterium]GHV54206.1 hypothetical protein FACS1894216_13760 [Synergistales bacterium]
MSEKREVWMVGDVLEAMSGDATQGIPQYVMNVVNEIQAWLADTIAEESQPDQPELLQGVDRQMSADLDYLFAQIERVNTQTDIIPANKELENREDAIILSLGPILLDEGLRMMVDHVALFSGGACKRAWIISDTWVIGDVLPYMPHLKALCQKEIELRFLLVTPWGYSEIPWTQAR